ncbi:MAG: FMN reductase [Nocardiopsaceae bacterium]|nr:FMN reductase [Nocardiopsaceae bacterium]
MSTTLTTVTLLGSYSTPSKTAALAELIVATVADRIPVDSHVIDVHTLGPGFTGALARDDLAPEVLAEVKRLESADLVVAASPVFRGSYTGLFKHFVDMVDQYALANTPVMLAATGGSDRHALVLDHALRPLFAFLQALVAPVGVYASAGDFAGTEILNPEVYARIEVAVDDMVPLLRARTAHRSEEEAPEG